MRTVAETPIFQRYATEIWSTSEREQFISFIASNPEAGDLIRGSGGCRKVRWSTSGQGKSVHMTMCFITLEFPVAKALRPWG